MSSLTIENFNTHVAFVGPVPINSADAREIAAKAEPLLDRVSEGHTGEELDRSMQEVLNEWEERLTVGGESWLDVRIRRTDIIKSDVIEYMSFSEWPASETLPEWTAQLQLLSSEVSDCKISNIRSELENSDIPFEPLWEPIARWATSTSLIPKQSFLTPGAKRSLASWLVRRISRNASRVAHVQYAEFLSKNDKKNMIENSNYSNSYSNISRFIRETINEGISSIFTNYPVLAEKIIVLCENWKRSVDSLLTHLEFSRNKLEEKFGIPESDSVTDIQAGLGDHHMGGRSVTLVTFESGKKIIYKPRSVKPELKLYTLINSIAEESGMASPSISVLSGDGYGWIEYVPNRDVSSNLDIKQYYRQIGLLLFSLYVSNGSDCHFENIRGNGSMPVFIDGETFGGQSAPTRLLPKERRSQKRVAEVVQSSVLRTDLLPYQFEALKQSFEIWGLSQEDEVTGPNYYPNWIDINSDAMAVKYTRGKFDSGSNLPEQDGEIAPPVKYVDQITKAFKRAYTAVANSPGLRTELLALFDTAFQSRFLLRPTHVYSAGKSACIQPSALRNRVKHDVKLEALLLPLLNTYPKNIEKSKKIFESEKSQYLKGMSPDSPQALVRDH